MVKYEEPPTPTPEEFKRACRKEFSYLNLYGFREVVPRPSRYPDPYEVCFEKEGWWIVVGSVDYRTATEIEIRSPDGRSSSFSYFVSRGFSMPQRESFARGQLGNIRYEGLCFRLHGEKFLLGEKRWFDELVQMAKEWSIANDAAWVLHDRKMDMERAIQKAAVAFGAGRYAEAAKELSAFEPYLPPGQVRKLEISRKRI